MSPLPRESIYDNNDYLMSFFFGYGSSLLNSIKTTIPDPFEFKVQAIEEAPSLGRSALADSYGLSHAIFTCAPLFTPLLGMIYKNDRFLLTHYITPVIG
jgi:hypothetical protein